MSGRITATIVCYHEGRREDRREADGKPGVGMDARPTEDLGLLLRALRGRAGLTQEELAARAGEGLSARTLRRVERGQTRPYRHTLEALAAALGLGAEDRRALLAAWRALPATPRRQALEGAETLPLPPTPLIGREREEATVADLLRRDGARLVTLTGPGGVGKTRLALQAAAGLDDAFPDGVIFVELAALGDPRLVPATIAREVGLQEFGERPLPESLIAFLREKRTLLVLDSFEHVAAAAPLVADLLGACRRLALLATSRARLDLREEREVVIAPLALPDPANLSHPMSVAESPAVALFTQRARAVAADFALTDANAPAVAEICRRLDGLPLALELAAPWIKLLPPAALLARLERRLPLLTSRAPDLPPRQRTLRNTIAWSYDLLDAAEQRLFRRLAVFAGGCTLEAAEAVCPSGADPDAHPDAHPDAADQPGQGELALLEGVASLVDKSLLRQEEVVSPRTGAPEPRLLLLDTVREFALDLLATGGEEAALRRRHAAYFLALVEEAEPALRGPEQRAWRERLEGEHDNLRAALGWARESGDVGLGLRLAGALWPFWYTRGHLSEGRQWLEELLARAEPRERATLPAARAILWAATFAAEQGDYGRAATLCDEGEVLCGASGDTWGLAWALNVRGVLALRRGDHQGAAALLERSAALFRSLDDRWSVAMTLSNLGVLARSRGDGARATALYDESLALTREIGDMWSVALTLVNLGEIAKDRGDMARAAALCEESLALFRAVGDQRGMAYALTYLGGMARTHGDDARALDLYVESLALWRHVGERSEIAACLEGLAGAASALGQRTHAARFLGAAAALRGRIGAPVPPADQQDYERTAAAVRSALGHAFTPAWEVGQALPLDQVLDEALAIEGATEYGRTHTAETWGPASGAPLDHELATAVGSPEE